MYLCILDAAGEVVLHRNMPARRSSRSPYPGSTL